MGLFKILNKKEVLIGGVNKEVLDAIKKVYKINPKFNYHKFSEENELLNISNILEYLKSGIDLNHTFKYNAIPIYMRCEDNDSLEICKYFGIDLNLSKYVRFGDYSVQNIPYNTFLAFSEFMSNFDMNSLSLAKNIDILKWLKNNGKSFKPVKKEEASSYPVVWDILIDFDENGIIIYEESVNFILKETDFSFNYEFQYLDEKTKKKYIYKTWYSYFIDCAKMSDFKYNDVKIDINFFFELYKDKIDFADTTIDGENIYIILKNNLFEFNFELFKVIFMHGISPFVKNKRGETFYDYCLKNNKKFREIINYIENSELFKVEELVEREPDKIEELVVKQPEINLKSNIYEKIDIPSQIRNLLYISSRKDEVKKMALERSKNYNWLIQKELITLMESYDVDMNFSYYDCKELNRSNIINFIKSGGDLNYKYLTNIIEPSFDYEVLDICILFGFNLENKLRESSWRIEERIDLKLWNLMKPYILRNRVDGFKDISLQHAKWLNENNFSFVPSHLNDEDDTNEIPFFNTLITFNGLNFRDSETAEYILTQTNFNFDFEYLYFGHDVVKGCTLVKVWFMYLLKQYNDRGSKIERFKDVNLFLEFYKNRINLNGCTSEGENLYLMLNFFNANQQYELLELFLEYRINPFYKNKNGISFYDKCLKKPKMMSEAIKLIESRKEVFL